MTGVPEGWVPEVQRLLQIANRAADKLHTMYLRREGSPRAELDWLMDEREAMRVMRKRLAAIAPSPPPPGVGEGEEGHGLSREPSTSVSAVREEARPDGASFYLSVKLDTLGSPEAVSAYDRATNALHVLAQATGCPPGFDVFAWASQRSEAIHAAWRMALKDADDLLSDRSASDEGKPSGEPPCEPNPTIPDELRTSDAAFYASREGKLDTIASTLEECAVKGLTPYQAAVEILQSLSSGETEQNPSYNTQAADLLDGFSRKLRETGR